MAVGAKTEIFILDIKTTDSNIKIRIQDLSIGYRNGKAVTKVAGNINFEIAEGELVAIIGVNGVGKSTLLRSLAGIQEVLEGSIYIDEQPLEKIEPARRAELLSLVLTEQPVSKNLSVFELLALGRQPYTNWIGRLTLQDQEHIEKAIQLIDIEELKNKKCYEISDGQFQKALIGRAIAQDTPVIILDEPTTHLDIYHQAYVLKLLKNLSIRTRKSILFATHEIEPALQLCDKIIMMTRTSVEIGTPEELIETGALSNLFPQDLILFDKQSRTFKIKS